MSNAAKYIWELSTIYENHFNTPVPFFDFFLQCQFDRIDTLISKISNDQMIASCASPSIFKSKNLEADSLIQIAIIASNNSSDIGARLFKIQSDTSRNIEVDSLIELQRNFNKVEKEITDKLYKLLTNTNKGIIAHYILTNINYYVIKVDLTCLNSNYKSGLLKYDYYGLRFFQNKYKKLFARKRDLRRVKQGWYNRLYRVVTVCCQE